MALQANLEDPRFGAIFNNPNFALDPTDPRFIHTAGTADIATAVAKRKGRKAALSDAAPEAAVAPFITGDAQPNFVPCFACIISMFNAVSNELVVLVLNIFLALQVQGSRTLLQS